MHEAVADCRSSPPWRSLDGDLAAHFFDGLLDGLGVSLGHTFLDGAGSAFHQGLGFAQAEAGGFADGLEHLDLGGGVETIEDGVELALLFNSLSGSCRGAAAITTPAEAAADTPKASSICLTSSEASSSERVFRDSRIWSVVADMVGNQQQICLVEQ